MSRSPERISSYRRHFEDSSSSSYQVRVSSPSPTRRGTRHAFFGYSCRTGASSMPGESVGRGTMSGARRTRMSGAGASAGTLVCVGPNGERPIDLNVAAAENQEFLNTRTNERQEMVVLNDRLAVYIEKVRSLEQKNKLLEAEIEAYRNRFQKPTGLRLLYEEQLKELKKIADQMRVQRDISLAAKDGTAAQLEAIKIKYDEAVELRRKAELDIEALRPDVDKATSSRIVLEKKLEQLEVDIKFLKRVQQQEIDELMNQIYAAHVSVQTAFTLPDLAAALKQIQTQYDDIAAKNLQEMDSWYKNKFEDLTDKTTRHVDTTRSIREEMSSAKKDIQSKEHDLDTLRTRNEALEARIRETQEKYKKELEDLQARIEALQLEMKSTKEKIALHLREYQDLLNVKMSLEIEITTYRKLVEGEDLRLSGMMQTLSLTSCGMSAIGGGMSFGGGGMGGVGGVGGGLIGDSGGSVGGMGRGAGVGEGMGAGGMSGRMGAGGMGGRMGAGGPVDGRADGPDMGGGHGFAVGVGGGVGAGAGGMGTGGDVGAPGMSGVGSGAGSFGARFGELDTGAGDVGAAGLGTSARGVGAAGLGTGAGGVGAAGLGDAGGVGAAALRTNAGGVSAAGLGTGAGGVGAAGFGTGAGGVGAAGLGTGAGSVGLGNVAGGKGDSSRDGLGMGAGGGTTCSDNIEGTGMEFSGGVDGVGGRMSDGICGGIDRYGGMGPASMGSGIRGSGGTKVAGGGDVDALSGIGGMGKVGGGRGDPIVITVGHGSNGYNPNNDNYMQAVELTERRTVLIRTVKNEDDVLEMNHQEKTYTITGAADDSDDD